MVSNTKEEFMQSNHIRRLRDGSIDLEFCLEHARQLRSDAVWSLMTSGLGARAIAVTGTALLALIVLGSA
jgi:hypothetical protein